MFVIYCRHVHVQTDKKSSKCLHFKNFTNFGIFISRFSPEEPKKYKRFSSKHRRLRLEGAEFQENFWTKDRYSLTSSGEPTTKGTRWWMVSGWTSRILCVPVVARPPACSMRNAMGLHSYRSRSCRASWETRVSAGEGSRLLREATVTLDRAGLSVKYCLCFSPCITERFPRSTPDLFYLTSDL